MYKYCDTLFEVTFSTSALCTDSRVVFTKQVANWIYSIWSKGIYKQSVWGFSKLERCVKYFMVWPVSALHSTREISVKFRMYLVERRNFLFRNIIHTLIFSSVCKICNAVTWVRWQLLIFISLASDYCGYLVFRY